MDTRLTANPVSTASAVHDRAVALGARDPDGKPGFLLSYLRNVYQLAPQAGLSPDWIAVQASHETDFFRSPIWRARGNPAGIGVTDGADLGYGFDTGTDAARAHIVHMWGYVKGTVVASVLLPYLRLDPRWDALMQSGMAGTVTTIDDLGNGRWASDPAYPAGLRRHYAALIAPDETGTGDAAGEDNEVTQYVKHTWPGLANPVYLPASLKASVQIIPASVPGWTDWTAATHQTTYTQHFTGNMDSSAQSEHDWAARGGRAQINSPGSYQLIVDGREVIVCLAFDRAAGHAANNTGNLTSFASEMAIAGGYEAAFQNACHVAAGVLVAKGWEADTTLVQHRYWRRSDGTYKWCPAIILDKNDWSRYLATVARNIAAIRVFLGDESPAPVPVPVTYAKPAIIPELDAISTSHIIAPFFVTGGGADWVWVGDRVRVVNPTGRYQRASTDSERVGPDLKKGEEFDLDFVTQFNGEYWGYTPYGTRIRMKDVERVSDTKAAA